MEAAIRFSRHFVIEPSRDWAGRRDRELTKVYRRGTALVHDKDEAMTAIKDRCLKLLAYPDTIPLSLDCPETTIRRRQIIREKLPLRQIYDEWYRAIARSIPLGDKPVLELGSGAGFMSSYVPNLITSDILNLPGVDQVIDACAELPFEGSSLRGIAMVNTFHHLPDVMVFLAEAIRCLQPGGTISMIEPWNTPWSRRVYSNLHHEPFDPYVASWGFESNGPLSGANGALPWIVFDRDRQRFHERFPELTIQRLRPMMPVRYLLSGGVSMRALLPSWSFGLVKVAEQACHPVVGSLAMFAHVALSRR
jgi:SAM-dependent methyltransferase